MSKDFLPLITVDDGQMEEDVEVALWDWQWFTENPQTYSEASLGALRRANPDSVATYVLSGIDDLADDGYARDEDRGAFREAAAYLRQELGLSSPNAKVTLS